MSDIGVVVRDFSGRAVEKEARSKRESLVDSERKTRATSRSIAAAILRAAPADLAHGMGNAEKAKIWST